MNIDRLKTLSAYLKTLPIKGGKRAFDMSVWVNRLTGAERKKHGCGTSACALGHAAYIPEFRVLGLTPVRGTFGKVLFEGEEGVYAARKFFDLGRAPAHSLFTDYVRSPKAVARKIDTLIRAHELGMDTSNDPQ